MSLQQRAFKWRDWFPVPDTNGRIWLGEWLLLEGNRNAVTASLLTVVFVSLMVIGSIWTFEMQRLLTETNAVQTILNTMLSGIILLVSIVVSINSIVLSHDITSLDNQQERIGGIMDFRQRVSRLSRSSEKPRDPASFLALMAEVIQERTDSLKEAAEGDDEEFAEELQEYVDMITNTASRLNEPQGSGEFSVIWLGLEVDYGPHIDRSHSLKTSYGSTDQGDFDERLDDLIEAFELFATGKEYFKTLYYTEEVSQLSRTLVTVSLPAILLTATSILAIDAGLLPQVRILGFPPLLAFVSVTVTIALTPFIILTAYTLRLATVARQTAGAGPFSLQQ